MKIRLVSNSGAVTIDGTVVGDPSIAVDATIDVGSGTLRPGLINAHDHLHRNHYPRLGEPPYPNAYAWGDDLHSRFAAGVAHAGSLSRETALLFGAFKNLLGGTTTVVHHDRWEEAFESGFPVRVPRIRTAHSLRLDTVDASFSDRLAIHLAEGTDADSADELRIADEIGLLHERLLAVHLVGIDDEGADRFRRSGAAIVWCPTSNHFLYRRTAPGSLFATGADVLIGTDALVSGTGTLLEELAAARALGMVSDDRLTDAVGRTAARRLGIEMPALSPGSPADVVLLRKPLLDARPCDVALVLVAGKPQLADESLRAIFDIAEVDSQPLIVGGVEKRIAAPLAHAAREVFALSPDCSRIVA